MLNVKSKRAAIGLGACVAVVALTFAGMAVTTTSGAGTDTAPPPTLTAVATAAATPAASTPPQSPVEPPAAAAAANSSAGDQAGANTLPSAGYGDQGGNGNGLLFLVLAGSILAAGTALTVAGRLPNSRKQ